MKNTMRAVLAASLVLGIAACGKQEATPATEAQQALVAPAKDDDAGWRQYLQAVAVQNMGTITNNPYLYYLSPEPAAEDQEYEEKYTRQSELITTSLGRGVSPGNMLVFGSSASSRMADMIEAGFNGVEADSMKGVRVVFIGAAADNARVQTIVQPTGADYIFVEAK